jgi:hypothetical protein
MANLPVNYVKKVKEKTTWWGTWEPGRLFRVGDIIVWNSKEGFTRETTLEQHLKKVAVLRPHMQCDVPRVDHSRRVEKQEGYDYGATYRAAAGLGAGADVVPAVKASVGTRVSFSGAASFLMILTNRRVHSYTDLPAARDLLKRLRRAKDRQVWDPKWALVSEVIEVEQATVIVAEAKNAEVGLDADVRVNSARDLSVAGDISFAGGSQSVQFFITKRACTPLFKALETWRFLNIGPVQARTIQRRAARAAPRRATAKRATAKRATTKRATAKRATAKRATAKRATAKRATAKRATVKRATVKRATAKRATAKGSTVNGKARKGVQATSVRHVPASMPRGAGAPPPPG